MLLWIAMALMTGAAVLAALWPLSRAASARPATPDSDLGFYRDQLSEIDREIERGLIPANEAAAAKAEAGRRLLRARDGVDLTPFSTGEPALRRRRAAAAFSLSVVPLIALAIYGALGSPQLPSRGAAQAADTDIAVGIQKIEQHLAAHPEDGRGWDVLAPIYLRTERFAEAAKAYGAARRVAGDTVERLTGQGEALVAAGGGVVSADAAEMFERALVLDPTSAKASFYRALGAEQDGQTERARSEYRAMLANAPAEAPWVSIVQGRLANLSGGAGPAMPEGAVTPEIRAMVEGLDQRLVSQGGTGAEWARLVRSFAALGRREDAQDRLSRARAALAGEKQALADLDRLGGELGLAKREATR